MPSVGAGTANTEFEVMTGMNMRFFGPGEYPFKTYLKEKTAESAATALGALGYGTHGLHNNVVTSIAVPVYTTMPDMIHLPVRNL